jgi:hypothetical protein
MRHGERKHHCRVVLLPLPQSGTLESTVPDSSRQLSRHRLHFAAVAPKLQRPLPRLQPAHVQTRSTSPPSPAHPRPPNSGSCQTYPHSKATYATAATTVTARYVPQIAAVIPRPGWLRSRLQPRGLRLPPPLGACMSLQPAAHSRGQLVPVF